MADMVALRKELESLARHWGADAFGIADLAPAKDFIAEQAQKVNWPAAEAVVTRFPRAVSLGVHLPDALVETTERELPITGSPYGHYIYQVVSPHLDVIALRVVGLLQAEGYQAFPIVSSLPVHQTESLFSHKLAAHLAGLGWIGKSCLLVSPRFGPRVRFATVLTDAPLEPGEPLRKRCGQCHSCVDACPVGAFTGKEFRSSEPRETRFDPLKCAIFRNGAPNDASRRTRSCGLCVSACPIGKQRR